MGAANYIFANTGQLVRLVVQTVGADGYLSDGYNPPVVESVIYPDLSIAAGYPRNMTRLDTGLYASGLLLPEGDEGLGTYIANVYWYENGQRKNEAFAIVAARPFGISSVSPI